MTASLQPEQELSPLKVNSALAEYTTLPPRCLVFAMSDGDEEDVAYFDGDGDDLSYTEAECLDLKGDFKISPYVFGQQHLDSNALKQVECDAQCLGSVSDCDAKSVAPVSYDGSIADCAPAVDSETKGCAVSVSLNAAMEEMEESSLRLQNRRKMNAAMEEMNAAAERHSAWRLREMTHMNSTCLGAAHVRPSCNNG